MENPPDLIVAVTSDDQYHEKTKEFIGNIFQQHNQPNDKCRVENYLLNDHKSEFELAQLRTEIDQSHHSEYDEQTILLTQCFQNEIQSISFQHKQLTDQVNNHLSIYLTNLTRGTIENIDSLRLLHENEFVAHSKSLHHCIQRQSHEMNELYRNLIDQSHQTPINLFQILTQHFQTALNDLKTSFDSKLKYLNDIHSTTIEKLNTKHDIELSELKCELNLFSNRRT